MTNYFAIFEQWVLPVVVTTMGGVTIAWMANLGKRTAGIENQVCNSHDSNLRDDIDQLKSNLAGHDQFRADTIDVLKRQDEALSNLAKALAQLAIGQQAQAAAQEQANHQINILIKHAIRE